MAPVLSRELMSVCALSAACSSCRSPVRAAWKSVAGEPALCRPAAAGADVSRRASASAGAGADVASGGAAGAADAAELDGARALAADAAELAGARALAADATELAGARALAADATGLTGTGAIAVDSARVTAAGAVAADSAGAAGAAAVAAESRADTAAPAPGAAVNACAVAGVGCGELRGAAGGAPGTCMRPVDAMSCVPCGRGAAGALAFVTCTCGAAGAVWCGAGARGGATSACGSAATVRFETCGGEGSAARRATGADSENCSSLSVVAEPPRDVSVCGKTNNPASAAAAKVPNTAGRHQTRQPARLLPMSPRDRATCNGRVPSASGERSAATRAA